MEEKKKKKKEKPHTDKNPPPSPSLPLKTITKFLSIGYILLIFLSSTGKTEFLLNHTIPLWSSSNQSTLFLFSSLLFSGKQEWRSIMKVKSKKYCTGYLDKPDGENRTKGILK